MNREPLKITISSTGISLGATEAQPGDTLEFIALGDDPPSSVTVSLIDGGRGGMETVPPTTGGKDFQVDLSGFSATYGVPGQTTVPALAPGGSYKLAAGRHDATLKLVSLARSGVVAPSGAPRRLALLIGIDRYEPEASSLHGCVNDVDAIEDVLLDGLKMPASDIRKLASRHPGGTRVLRVSPEKLPTRENICDALVTLAADAQKGDIVFIYYSGHGVQWTDGTSSIEGMVPMDSATPLWDFDFTPLLTSIATKCGDLTVVLDCCHSGGVPRDIKMAKRSLPFAGPRPTSTSNGKRGPRDAAGPEMLVIAACQSEQSAYESPAGEPGAHGVLTRMLLAAFEKVKGSPLSSLRWAEVWESVRAAILDTKSPQSPLLLGRAERPVFGGAWTPQSDGWPVLHKDGKFTLRAGSMVGITEGATLEVYVGNARLGELVVSSAELASSVAVLSQGDAAAFPEAGSIARLIKRVEDEKLVVKLDPWNDALAKDLVDRAGVRATKGGATDLPSWECVIGVSADGKHVSADGKNQLWLGDEIHGERPGMEPPLVYVDAGDWSALSAAVHHFEDYNQVLRLVQRCQPDLVRIRLIDRGDPSIPSSLDLKRLNAQPPPELPHNPESPYAYSASDKRKWRVSVENLSDQRLYVSLFDAASDGTVGQTAKAVEIPGKQTHAIWADGGKAFRCVTGARPSTVDRIIVVATTNPNADLDGLVLSGTFTQATQAQARKTVVDDSPADELWAAAMVTLKTVKSL
jgi:hypothetical protein